MTVATKYCLSYMWQDVLTYFYFPKTDAWGLTSAQTAILFVTKEMFNLQRCKKEKKSQPFLSCTVTYLLLLGKVINIFLLWTNLGAQPCKEGSSRHVGNISVWHCSWSRDLPVHRSSTGALALQRSGVCPDTVSNPVHKHIEGKPQEEDLLPPGNRAEFSGTEVKEKHVPFFSVQWFSLLPVIQSLLTISQRPVRNSAGSSFGKLCLFPRGFS